jgi:hypothetical protein
MWNSFSEIKKKQLKTVGAREQEDGGSYEKAGRNCLMRTSMFLYSLSDIIGEIK